MSRSIVLKKYTVVVSLLLLFFGCFKICDAEDNKSSYISSELPDIVIAYSHFCSHYLDEFKTVRLDSNNAFSRLERNLDQLKCDISTRLAFTHRSFIVQNMKGYYAGYKKIGRKSIEVSKIPYEGILFVTTPIEKLDNRILIFLSSIRPEESTIVEIDNELNTKLIYDSFNNRSNVGISTIYQIRLISPGNFLLEGGTRPPLHSVYYPSTYILKVIDSNAINIKETNGEKSDINNRCGD